VDTETSSADMADLAARSRQGHAAKKAAAAKTVAELVREAGFDPEGVQGRQIVARVSQMPRMCIVTYLRAMRGRSLRAAAKAHCQMCMGWDDFREGIRGCTDRACPLYPYRPYSG